MMFRMNRRARTALLAGLGLAGLAATGLITHRHVPDIVGPAQVIDGDSIRVAGIEIRLYGIDAPEFRQICMRAGHPWACGRGATRFGNPCTTTRQLRHLQYRQGELQPGMHLMYSALTRLMHWFCAIKSPEVPQASPSRF